MGAAGMAAAGNAGTGPVSTSTLTKLTFDFTTKTYSGKYAPKNVGAVWVEDMSGKWIHTLEYWGSTPNDVHLTKYVATKAPDYALYGPLDLLFMGKAQGSHVTDPPPDVVSSATATTHKAHVGDAWNLKDLPDGTYHLVIEIAEDELSEKTAQVPFTKGAMPVTDMPADAPIVSGMKLTLQ